MKNINILDSNTIDKIAAGEVVERPVAVAKELIENSIDAGADAITIEIKEGGISFLRISDNGEGIDRSQIKKAFIRHATSKIKSIEDLISVSSLGFRGEALSSISSVARVELLTKTKEELLGTRYVIEGGREMVLDDAGIPDGTTIIVKDLFFNIPARRKFLKSSQTEGGYITELVEHMILSHPQIAFKYIINGNVKLQSPGNNDIKGCIYSVYGRDIASGLIEVNAKRDDISIHGFIGKPELSRGTRNLEIYYVNNRFIRSSLVEKALDEAYKYHLMLHKYPVVFLYFDIPGFLIDVNVHPAKKEIRFLEAESLKQFIEETVKEALDRKELIPEVHAKSATGKIETPAPDMGIKSEGVYNPEPFLKKQNTSVVNSEAINISSTQEPVVSDISKSSDDSLYINYSASDEKSDTAIEIESRESNIKKNNEGTLAEDIAEENNVQLSLFEDKFLTEEAVKKHRIIGQLFDTYWLIEYDSKLYIIDQHAAHEKVNYERLIKKLRNNEKTSQMIYPPVVVSLTNTEADFVNKYSERFEEVGFVVEHFGGREYTISAVPTELLSQDPKEYYREMLDELIEGRYSKETESVNLRIATMACKASVKGNMHMSIAEADALITELLSLENPYNCPHGRPTIVSYSKYEIEKMFKRIVN